jgi:hypothetical protein
MAAADSWDSWLNEQATTAAAARPKAPIDLLGADGRRELVQLAAEVQQAQQAAQEDRKHGKKGRKARLGGDGKQPVVFSESFEALKQRLLQQTIEAEAPRRGEQASNAAVNSDSANPEAASSADAADAAADGVKGPSKSKLKRQQRKAAAAKRKQLKLKGGSASGEVKEAVAAPRAEAGGAGEDGEEGEEHALTSAAGVGTTATAPQAMSATADRYLEDWQQAQSSRKRKAADSSANGSGGWKFKKAVQIWLLKHAYFKSRLSGTSFKRFLAYLCGLKGKAAHTTLAQVQALRTRYAAACDASTGSAAAALLVVGAESGDEPTRVLERADKTLAVLQKICDAQSSKLRVQDK